MVYEYVGDDEAEKRQQFGAVVGHSLLVCRFWHWSAPTLHFRSVLLILLNDITRHKAVAGQCLLLNERKMRRRKQLQKFCMVDLSEVFMPQFGVDSILFNVFSVL